MTGPYIAHRPPPAGQPVVALYGRPVSAAHNASPGTHLSALASRFVPSSDWRDRCAALLCSLAPITMGANQPLAAKAIAPRSKPPVSPAVEPQTVLDYALLPATQGVVGVAGFFFGLVQTIPALRCQRSSLTMLAVLSSNLTLGMGISLLIIPKELLSPAAILSCEIAVVAGSLLSAVACDVDEHLQRKLAKHAEPPVANDRPDDK